MSVVALVSDYDSAFGNGAFVEDFGAPPMFYSSNSGPWSDYYDQAEIAIEQNERAVA